MYKHLLALALVACLAGNALAQTAPVVTNPYTGLEGFFYSGMTPQQQSNYNSMQAFVTLSTQIVTMAFYKQVEKKFERGDVLNPYEASVLSRGPLAVTTGNQAFVPVGTP